MAKVPFYRNHLIRDSIGRAIYDAMKLDPSIYLFGEGAEIKMHYDAPQIEKEFPNRVVTMPICEDGSTNFAVGASLLGVKPVVDVITSDFLYRTMDSICNTAAKINFVLPDSEPRKTIVIRAEFLTGGPTTGQRPEALFTHIPGLQVVVPSTPRDAYGLMCTALMEPGVTIFFEDRMIQDAHTEPGDLVGQESDAIHFGRGKMRWYAIDPKITLATYGLMRQVAETALPQELRDKVEMIDLRTLYPLDWDLVLDSLSRTNRLLIVEPDVAYGGIGAEIAATIAEKLPRTVIQRLGGPRETISASPVGHARMIPGPYEILKALKQMGAT